MLEKAFLSSSETVHTLCCRGSVLCCFSKHSIQHIQFSFLRALLRLCGELPFCSNTPPSHQFYGFLATTPTQLCSGVLHSVCLFGLLQHCNDS